MNTAQERAREIRQRHAVHCPGDMERVLAEGNIEFVRFPLAGRLDEVIVLNTIGVRDSIEDVRQVYELLAHALGHYLLHAGNQIEFVLPINLALSDQWERQAWDFAFELLMPADQVESRLREGWSESDLQDDFQVSDEFFLRRMEAFRRDLGTQFRTVRHDYEYLDDW
jgi:Zn-dependent peptidase ImmA (M78 family)